MRVKDLPVRAVVVPILQIRRETELLREDLHPMVIIIADKDPQADPSHPKGKRFSIKKK